VRERKERRKEKEGRWSEKGRISGEGKMKEVGEEEEEEKAGWRGRERRETGNKEMRRKEG